ncbi:hypothetical protein [Microbacterium paraoxydans]|uniref:hypothetical protein n=1 Tax=Microbacterium paraoxydans TaxID=199592 RepID=UPI0011A0A0F8|nr:hypothetical protein [Microbacterium paraoxydans]
MAKARQRPVYVLGAGFSRAISEMMPLTDELGDALLRRVELNSSDGQEMSFEERLTVLSTPLPFLQGYENTIRRADAEKITAGIADVLDSRVAAVTRAAPPLWLLQLVALWHAEQAIVLTFNYDTLVESAFGALGAVRSDYTNGISYELDGKQIVYPAPRSGGGSGMNDIAAADDSSFQLLKLHGSLSWYWSSGDGSTVVQDRTVPTFGQKSRASSTEVSGIRTLDRFLIPPVLSKDSYYNVNIAHMLWRTAHEAIANASRVTILGYSLPAGDRITAELLRRTPTGTPVDIINRDLGDPGNPTSPTGRASALQLAVDRTWGGDNAVASYVKTRLADRAPAMHQALAAYDDEPVIATVSLHELRTDPATFILRSYDGGNDGVEVNMLALGQSTTSPHDMAKATVRSFSGEDDFHTVRTLRDVVRKSVFHVRLAERPYVAIGARRIRIGQWKVIELQLAPSAE